jgi:hypothetical protein
LQPLMEMADDVIFKDWKQASKGKVK